MNRLALTFVTLFAFAMFAYAGTEYSGKEMKQVAPAPCPEWYGDTEWNIGLWGAYAFGNPDHPSNTIEDALVVTGSGFELGRGVIGDEAWGGGIDLKYFFHRYFGVGIEGYILATDREDLTATEVRLGFSDPDNTVGAVKGTVTFRYPIGCTRFAPYIYAGGGALFGADRQRLVFNPNQELVRHDDDDARAIGQVGGGLEVRITRHIGWIADFSWNFTEDDDFGMVRSGINFAF